ncbi:hypothetical protein HPB52_024466 [Rhipicephalus sanguineus]|uniref:Uncharacterized protein n=1 Tax=Rhipicephalus sanguineus TaxID=34632 RepID=A0A9D4YR37_RHISA|nr:hypothetical protein HPB52_024466 [Rhipicephalus sanguineus]
MANLDEQHKCDPKCRLRKSPAFAKDDRQFPTHAGRSASCGSSRSRSPSPPATSGPSERRSRCRRISKSRGKSGFRGKSRSRSRSRSVYRTRSGSSFGQQRKRKSNLTWAEKLRGGSEARPSRGPGDPLPEQAKDGEVMRLHTENAELKEIIKKMASERTEIKKLVISQSASGKASATNTTEVPFPASDTAGAPKHRALSSKEQSGSQINEIKGMLATLTTSVQQLQQRLAQVQVALGDP